MEDASKEGIPLPIPEKDGKHTTNIRLIKYNSKSADEKRITDISKCSNLNQSKTVTWLDVTGLKDSESISKIGKCFGLHPLVLEDILTTRQRPKLEDYDKYLYFVVRMLSRNGKSITSDQLSIVLGKNYILTFREKDDPVFSKVEGAIRRNKGKIRRSKADFLAYALLDEVVDNYFLVLEGLGEHIGFMEAGLITSPKEGMLLNIRKLKKEMLILRRAVWPLREVVLALDRESRNLKPLISQDTAIYLRDVYDHTIQVMDATENLREVVSGMLEIYLSSLSNKMNEVMKVLTIIGTIFIPLTFVTGIYGMNFDYMPELDHPLGYFAVLGFMLAMSLGMLIYFRVKKWI